MSRVAVKGCVTTETLISYGTIHRNIVYIHEMFARAANLRLSAWRTYVSPVSNLFYRNWSFWIYIQYIWKMAASSTTVDNKANESMPFAINDKSFFLPSLFRSCECFCLFLYVDVRIKSKIHTEKKCIYNNKTQLTMYTKKSRPKMK